MVLISIDEHYVGVDHTYARKLLPFMESMLFIRVTAGQRIIYLGPYACMVLLWGAGLVLEMNFVVSRNFNLRNIEERGRIACS